MSVTTPDQEVAPETVSDPWQLDVEIGGRMVLLLGLCALALGLTVIFGVSAYIDDTAEPTLTTETDPAGRVCTIATTRDAVALDCDYPPAENRLGGWLDDLNTPTP